MLARQVRCRSCGVVNRVPLRSAGRTARCGKCGALLSNSIGTIFRQILSRPRINAASAIGITVVSVVGLWLLVSAVARLSSVVSIRNHTVVTLDRCFTRPQPTQGLYKVYGTQPDAVVPLSIEADEGSNYFVKVEDAVSLAPVMSFYIYGGSTLSTTVPEGNYVLHYARGKSFCGEKNNELFGPDTTIERVDQLLTFGVLTQGDHSVFRGHRVELVPRVAGNLRTSPISRNEF